MTCTGIGSLLCYNTKWNANWSSDTCVDIMLRRTATFAVYMCRWQPSCWWVTCIVSLHVLCIAHMLMMDTHTCDFCFASFWGVLCRSLWFMLCIKLRNVMHNLWLVFCILLENVRHKLWLVFCILLRSARHKLWVVICILLGSAMHIYIYICMYTDVYRYICI